jgi:hypothetical protein
VREYPGDLKIGFHFFRQEVRPSSSLCRVPGDLGDSELWVRALAEPSVQGRPRVFNGERHCGGLTSPKPRLILYANTVYEEYASNLKVNQVHACKVSNSPTSTFHGAESIYNKIFLCHFIQGRNMQNAVCKKARAWQWPWGHLRKVGQQWQAGTQVHPFPGSSHLSLPEQGVTASPPTSHLQGDTDEHPRSPHAAWARTTDAAGPEAPGAVFSPQWVINEWCELFTG